MEYDYTPGVYQDYPEEAFKRPTVFDDFAWNRAHIEQVISDGCLDDPPCELASMNITQREKLARAAWMPYAVLWGDTPPMDDH